jgi:hypothetical protein
MLTSRRALLLVAFYLLTSAATAHAECAWVLWTKQALLTKPESTPEFALQAAYSTLKTVRRLSTRDFRPTVKDDTNYADLGR